MWTKTIEVQIRYQAFTTVQVCVCVCVLYVCVLYHPLIMIL